MAAFHVKINTEPIFAKIRCVVSFPEMPVAKSTYTQTDTDTVPNLFCGVQNM